MYLSLTSRVILFYSMAVFGKRCSPENSVDLSCRRCALHGTGADVSLYLEAFRPELFPSNWQRETAFKFTIINWLDRLDGNPYESFQIFRPGFHRWGVSKLCESTGLSKDELQPNENFEIQVQIVVRASICDVRVGDFLEMPEYQQLPTLVDDSDSEHNGLDRNDINIDDRLRGRKFYRSRNLKHPEPQVCIKQDSYTLEECTCPVCAQLLLEPRTMPCLSP